MRRSILFQVGGDDAPGLEALVEQVRLAEQLGLDAVWCFPVAGETGRLDGSAPEIWLAVLAEHTQRIGLGWGRAGLLPAQRPPLRVAEQAASLDVASDGRLELALLPDAAYLTDSASPSGDETDWQEGYRMLVGMWEAGPFAWRSARFGLGPIDVVPKPVQRPHPPLWLAGWSDEHARAAGRGGLGYLDVSGAADDGLEVALDAYRGGRGEAEPEDLVSVEAFAVVADLVPGEAAQERLAAWEALGVDQAIARVGPAEGRRDATPATIRFLAGADPAAESELH